MYYIKYIRFEKRVCPKVVSFFSHLPLGCYNIYIPSKPPFEKGGLVATLPMVGATVAVAVAVQQAMK